MKKFFLILSAMLAFTACSAQYVINGRLQIKSGTGLNSVIAGSDTLYYGWNAHTFSFYDKDTNKILEFGLSDTAKFHSNLKFSSAYTDGTIYWPNSDNSYIKGNALYFLHGSEFLQAIPTQLKISASTHDYATLNSYRLALNKAAGVFIQNDTNGVLLYGTDYAVRDDAGFEYLRHNYGDSSTTIANMTVSESLKDTAVVIDGNLKADTIFSTNCHANTLVFSDGTKQWTAWQPGTSDTGFVKTTGDSITGTLYFPGAEYSLIDAQSAKFSSSTNYYSLLNHDRLTIQNGTGQLTKLDTAGIWFVGHDFTVTDDAPFEYLRFNYGDSSTTIFNKLILESPNDTMLSVRGNASFVGDAMVSGNFMTAGGYATNNSFSLGGAALGNTSVAIGGEASGNGSFAGYGSMASGEVSFSIQQGISTGLMSNSAIGGTASGDASICWGTSCYSNSYALTVFGQANDTILGTNKTTWKLTDPLFQIGNGSSLAARNNAFHVLKNGKTYIADASNTTDAILVVDPTDSTSTFIGTVSVEKSLQVGNDTTAASAANVGAIRYRSDANNSYCEMVMQTGASSYAWVIIKQNTW